MRVPTIDERFVDFLEGPTLDRWLAVREQLLRQADFDPYSALWRELESAFAAMHYERVLELSDHLERVGCLSPRFHFLTGIAAFEIGDLERAKWEQYCSQTCLQAIVQSGLGTPESPYLSTYPGDCYDVVMALGLAARGQALVDREGSWCDVLTAEDGREFWFDVTDLLERNSDLGGRRVAQNANLPAERLA